MELTNKRLSNMDLINNKYDLDILEKNINNLSKKFLLRTQKLTVEFCIKYIYDDDIDATDEDSYLFDKSHILETQQHITEEEFNEAIKKIT